MCPREITPSPPSISSGLTFRRFALSSVMFIVYGVDDEVADDEIYSDAPRSSGPAGRPSQSECLISYFWFSYFVAALFLLLLFLIFCPNRLSSPSRCPAFPTIELDLHHAINRASSKAYVYLRLSACGGFPVYSRRDQRNPLPRSCEISSQPNQRLPDNSPSVSPFLGSNQNSKHCFLNRVPEENFSPRRKIDRERNSISSVKHVNGIFARNSSR